MGCSRSKDAAADYAPSDAVSARLTNSSQPATEQTRRRAPVKPPLDTGRVPPQALDPSAAHSVSPAVRAPAVAPGAAKAPPWRGSGAAPRKEVAPARRASTKGKGKGGAADTDLDEYEKAVKREVVENLDASWDDIIGLEEVKSRLVREVVAPQVNPQLFEGARRPEKGVLLYGPPGNGKTLIAKAVASKCQATFFSISASSVVSKWVGDSEKSMRALFSLAQKMQPSVIFIDEIDSMLTARSTGEHEGARRLKTEFLKQTEGVTTSESDRVLVLGATNRPGDLDDAAMRRLPLRIYIPLPELETRKELVRNVLKSTRHCLSSAEFARLARETEGYSCSDLAALTREAAKAPFQNFTEEQLMSSTPDQVRDVSWADFQVALKRVKPSVSKATLDELKRFERRSG